MKKLLAGFSFIIMSLAFCSCAGEQLSEKAIVQAVGIDKEGEEYLVTVQDFKPYGSKEIVFDEKGQNNIVLSSKGQSIGEAINQMNTQYGKKVFFGNNSLLIIGRSLAEEGINDVLNYFNSSYEFNPNTNVLMAQDSAEDIVKAEIDSGKTPAMVLENSLKEYKNTAKIDGANIHKIIADINDENISAHMPVVKISYGEEDKPQYDIFASACFDEDRLSSLLDDKIISGMRWFNDDIKKADILINKKAKEKYFVLVNKNKTKIKVDIVDGVPVFNLKVKAKLSLKEALGAGLDGISEEEEERIKKLCENEIENNISSAFDYSLKNVELDFLGASRHILHSQPRYWKNNSKNWQQVMQKAKLVVNAECSFDTIGIKIKS